MNRAKIDEKFIHILSQILSNEQCNTLENRGIILRMLVLQVCKFRGQKYYNIALVLQDE